MVTARGPRRPRRAHGLKRKRKPGGRGGGKNPKPILSTQDEQQQGGEANEVPVGHTYPMCRDRESCAIDHKLR